MRALVQRGAEHRLGTRVMLGGSQVWLLEVMRGSCVVSSVCSLAPFSLEANCRGGLDPVKQLKNVRQAILHL